MFVRSWLYSLSVCLYAETHGDENQALLKKTLWQSQLPVGLEDCRKSLLKRIGWNRIDTQQIKQKTNKITEGHPVTADGGFRVSPVVIDWL